MSEQSAPKTHTSLVLGLKAGYGEAKERFRQEYSVWLRQWCARMVEPANADDLFQDVFEKLLRRMSSFDYDPTKGHFHGWLWTLMRNAASDLRKRNRRIGQGTGGDDSDNPIYQQAGREQPPEDEAGEREAQAARLDPEFVRSMAREFLAGVEETLTTRQLSSKSWKLFRDYVENEMPIKQLTAKYRMNRGAVATALFNVREWIRKAGWNECNALNA